MGKEIKFDYKPHSKQEVLHQLIEQAKIVDELNSQTQEIIKKKIKEDGEGEF